MPRVTIPLGVTQVRALRDNLKRLSQEMRDDIPTDIEQGVAAKAAELVIQNIAASEVDGNYLGTDNPEASVSVVKTFNGHGALWRGKQIVYVEFGTGAAGAAQPYPGVAMAAAGYYPDPNKDAWWYMDAKIGPWVSLGLPPQAPMYHAAGQMRVNHTPTLVTKAVLRGALNRASAI